MNANRLDCPGGSDGFRDNIKQGTGHGGGSFIVLQFTTLMVSTVCVQGGSVSEILLGSLLGSELMKICLS